MPILDQFGRPIVREQVVERSSRAWSFPEQEHEQRVVATGIDPSRLADVLRSNDRGEMLDLQTLAIEMEERDLHYYSQLQSRINAIAYVPWHVVPVDKTNKKARILAEEVHEVLIDDEKWKWLVQDLMDAVSKSYSVIQPVWDTSTRPWTFKSFEHPDCRSFHFHPDRGKELRIRVEDSPNGKALPPGVFLVHYPRIRTGVPIRRGGIARLAAVNWFFKTTSVTDWLAFAEVFGMPIRIAKYNPQTTTDDELSALHQALVNLGHDAAALVPKGADLEVIDARRPTSGDNVFKGLVQYLDEQTSRGILGQVLSSDARATGLGTAVAELHREVRQDIREADAGSTRSTLEKLVRMWVQFNKGPDAPQLRLRPAIEPPTNLQEFTEAVLPWFVQGGIKIGKEWLYDHLQIPVPEDGEETVEAPLAPGATAPGGPTPGVKSTSKKQRVRKEP